MTNGPEPDPVCTRPLDADVNELAWRQGLKTSQEGRYQGAEGSDPVRRCNEHDDGDRECTQILLMFQILIGRQEGVERTSRKLQQLAVSGARPAHCGNCANFVLGKQPGKRPGQRFIEQYAHRRSGNLWRVREQRPLVPVARWGNPRGTHPGCPRRQGSREDSSRALAFRRIRASLRGSRGRCESPSSMPPCALSYTNTRGAGGLARSSFRSKQWAGRGANHPEGDGPAVRPGPARQVHVDTGPAGKAESLPVDRARARGLEQERQPS